MPVHSLKIPPGAGAISKPEYKCSIYNTVKNSCSKTGFFHAANLIQEFGIWNWFFGEKLIR